jgi:CheY-like chemotaxis protein
MTVPHGTGEVIVADDDLMFSSRVSATLVRLGYRPVVVRTAAAVDTAVRDGTARHDLRAIIVNLAARGFDAAQAVRRLKQEETTRRTPVLGFCGHRDAARAEAAKAAGCDAVVTNGVIAADLERALRPLVEPTAPPARPT